MGASFRKVEQIVALAGCDRLTISPNLLEELANSEAPVERKLEPSTEGFHQPAPLSEAEFRWEHNRMRWRWRNCPTVSASLPSTSRSWKTCWPPACNPELTFCRTGCGPSALHYKGEPYVFTRELANAIRALSMDAVQKANSGHPVCRWAWLISPKCCGATS